MTTQGKAHTPAEKEAIVLLKINFGKKMLYYMAKIEYQVM
jgi:hypothetical protein